ncbi:hypothetical protein [Agarivorans gilvus]|uniref:hypothetical protein n=1 Tax=Agarivorans gilvus TaxID=680279 RepID=UPI0006EC100D|nr:hypothetical protein [Agarivorans gilvus]
MKNKIAVLVTLVGAVSLAGCSSAPKREAGILCPAVGAAFGGILGGGGGAVGGVLLVRLSVPTQTKIKMAS